MRNPSGARLSPDPLGLHSETLGEFVSGEQAVHDPSPDAVGQRADAGESARTRSMAHTAISMPASDGTPLSWRGRVGWRGSLRHVHGDSLGSRDRG
jgi:hypothetical protein